MPWAQRTRSHTVSSGKAYLKCGKPALTKSYITVLKGPIVTVGDIQEHRQLFFRCNDELGDLLLILY